jgi:hypothetical protein
MACRAVVTCLILLNLTLFLTPLHGRPISENKKLVNGVQKKTGVPFRGIPAARITRRSPVVKRSALTSSSKLSPPTRAKSLSSTQVCPKGYFRSSSGNSCYRYFNMQKSFGRAQAACKSVEGGSIAIANNAADHSQIMSLCQSGAAACWIGLNRVNGSKCTSANSLTYCGRSGCACAYKWTDGSSLKLNAWKPGRPKYTSASCVTLSAQGWIDVKCAASFAFICQGLFL